MVMGWSEWITPPESYFDPLITSWVSESYAASPVHGRMTGNFGGYGGTPVFAVHGRNELPGVLPWAVYPWNLGNLRSLSATSSAANSDYPSGIPYGARLASQYTADPAWLSVPGNDPYSRNWVDHRDWNPVFLSGGQLEGDGFWQPYQPGLIYGVDYIQRPDRTPADLDRFVEYESAVPNQPLRWTWKQPYSNPFTYLIIQADQGVTSWGGSAWVISIITDPAILNAGDTISSWPGARTTIATGNAGTVPNASLGIPPDGTISPSNLTFMLRLEQTTTQPEDAWGTADITAVQATPPRLVYQMPRYRYWKPGTPFLRSKSRNDGLGRSVGRGRGGSSRQSSGRGRGYL